MAGFTEGAIYMRTTILFFLLIAGANVTDCFAQDRELAQEYRRQQEQRKKAAILQELDSGVLLMDNEQYVLADEKFRYVLENIRSVPSDLTFYFGKNSYHLSKFKQSVDWLNKYIQLKGTTGQFYEEAVDYLKKAEQELVKEKETNSKKVEEVLSANYDIDCGPSGKVICPVCKGDHVITKPGPFGDQYKTCPYCDEHGILTCQEYNSLIRGQLKPRS